MEIHKSTVHAVWMRVRNIGSPLMMMLLCVAVSMTTDISLPPRQQRRRSKHARFMFYMLNLVHKSSRLHNKHNKII
jgi:hypothetical protein